MQEWILPRPLVRYLEALDLGLAEREELQEAVEAHFEGLRNRVQQQSFLILSCEEAPALAQAWDEASASFIHHLQRSADAPALLESASQLLVTAEEIIKRARELPRVTGNGPLDELFLLASNTVHGAEVSDQALLSALVGARGTVTDLERRTQNFARVFPQEREILQQLESALAYLRQGLGGVFLFATDEVGLQDLEVALKALVKGGNEAVACLAAMGAVSEASHTFSRDPVLEFLHRAWKEQDSERMDVALVTLEDSQQDLAGELEGLRRTFAPAGWRRHHLTRLQQAFEAMEASRDALMQAFEQEALQESHLLEFRERAARFDELEFEARESLPSRRDLPDVGNIVALVEMMAAIYEERAPFFPLEEQLGQLLASFGDYCKHLERLYDAQAGESEEFEDLVAAAEELGEALEMAQQGLDRRDASVFPQVWEELLRPLTVMDRYASRFSGESGSVVAKDPLPPFFEELRLLLEDRSRGLASDGEFQAALSRAESRTSELMSRLKAGAAAGSQEATELHDLAERLARLYKAARTGVGPGELAEVERLGRAWPHGEAPADS